MPFKLKKCPPVFEALIYHILKKVPGLNTIALMKTAYFIELAYKSTFGDKLTEISIVRLPKGPAYAAERNLLNRLTYHQVISEKKMQQASLFYANPMFKTEVRFTPMEMGIIDEILNEVALLKKKHPYKYSVLLTQRAYNTKPMKIIQNQEQLNSKKLFGKDLLKSPYFTIKSDADTHFKINKKKRDIQKMEMATKLNNQEKEKLQARLNMLKAKFRENVKLNHQQEPEITDEERQDIELLLKIQGKAMEKVLRS